MLSGKLVQTGQRCSRFTRAIAPATGRYAFTTSSHVAMPPIAAHYPTTAATTTAAHGADDVAVLRDRRDKRVIKSSHSLPGPRGLPYVGSLLHFKFGKTVQPNSVKLMFAFDLVVEPA